MDTGTDLFLYQYQYHEQANIHIHKIIEQHHKFIAVEGTGTDINLT